MEVYGNHRHVGPVDDPEARNPATDGPRSVPRQRVLLLIAIGREESYRLAVFQLPQGGAYAVDRHRTFRRIFLRPCVHSYEVGAHCRYLVENHVDHDLILWSARCYQMDQGYAVRAPNGWLLTVMNAPSGGLSSTCSLSIRSVLWNCSNSNRLLQSQGRGVAACRMHRIDLVDETGNAEASSQT